LKGDSFGQDATPELAFVVHVEPAVAVRVVYRKLVRGGFDAHPEITAFQHCSFVQDVDQTLDAPGFIVQLGVASGHADGKNGERDHDGHDHDHHQNLDERESPVAQSARHRDGLATAARVSWC
jgi:hypothetical protein